ncbi:hypothetical protein [Streptomyces sp. NPDC001820]|uniref:hypothetical protein n=1 Tax=Streptomyces sp. NPDC001820 TaxID=3364613 RepID=UPI0036856668
MARRDLDHGLELGNRSVDILARVQSTRAKDYVREFNQALAPGGASRPFASSSTAPAPNSASSPNRMSEILRSRVMQALR